MVAPRGQAGRAGLRHWLPDPSGSWGLPDSLAPVNPQTHLLIHQKCCHTASWVCITWLGVLNHAQGVYQWKYLPQVLPFTIAPSLSLMVWLMITWGLLGGSVQKGQAKQPYLWLCEADGFSLAACGSVLSADGSCSLH